MRTRTIEQGFRNFLRTLRPTSKESDAATSHRASIETCLKNNFGMTTRFFRTGSFRSGTSISGYSDVDYFAQIPPSNLEKSPTLMLGRVRDVLKKRFPRTGVRINRPAVVAPFHPDAKERTEITPVGYVGVTTKEKYKVYNIPDFSSGWMCSSPDAHRTYVRKIDLKLGGKVKPLIRFVKAWKYYQNVPVSSFYLELRVAKYVEGKQGIIYDDYDIVIKRIFAHLHDIQLARMQDPMKISGYIKPCSTDKILERTKSKLSTALTRAQKACDARKSGDIENAFHWWNKLYNGKFPSYYY